MDVSPGTGLPSRDVEMPSAQKRKREEIYSIDSETKEIHRLAAQKSWLGKSISQAAPTLPLAIDALVMRTEELPSFTSEEGRLLYEDLSRITKSIKAAKFEDEETKSTLGKIKTISRHLKAAET